eukprot:8108347-Alexandrium_andersonii.AAC.1
MGIGIGKDKDTDIDTDMNADVNTGADIDVDKQNKADGVVDCVVRLIVAACGGLRLRGDVQRSAKVCDRAQWLAAAHGGVQ